MDQRRLYQRRGDRHDQVERARGALQLHATSRDVLWILYFRHNHPSLKSPAMYLVDQRLETWSISLGQDE